MNCYWRCTIQPRIAYMYTVHVGYARLNQAKDNRELRWSDLFELFEGATVHGPALTRNTRQIILGKKYSLSNELDDSVKSEQIKIIHYDMVRAVHCPYWPVEANEWITRRRYHGFPSKSVIKQVIRYGCDFVQVSHKLSNDINSWRFSFSKAELFLIKSWTISQKIVYSTLWVLTKKMKASSNLCTYYFKTLMFWACEKNQLNSGVMIC